ncbi:MAG TPA: glycogen synthase GlgA [Actinobacteria bacterium]|nr:glycogen synthase GlgA [Actinomycetota bacterium]
MFKLAICSAEAVPFAKTGGLADVTGSLPGALKQAGNNTIVIMPGYEYIFSNFRNVIRIAENIKVRISAVKEDCFDIYKINEKGIDYFFIRNPFYFGRENLYGTPRGDYEDNNLRFGFFSRSILELLQSIDFKPDVLHLHDYHTGLCSFFLFIKKNISKNCYFKNTKTVFTIHNIAYQGIFGQETLELLDIDRRHFNMNELEFYGKINYMKSGIVYSDKITTVSPTYSREILTPEFGCRLEGILHTRKEDLSGIINGIDYELWNPEKDREITENYNSDSFSGKKMCKKALLDKLFRKPEYSRPVLGIVSRLSEQKGIDILIKVMKEILKEDIYIIILGTGDEKYMNMLKDIQKIFGDKISLNIAFSDSLARKIYAGSDIFLMPSKYEPCGLGQLISLKYGTIPVARRTGGLADTIIDIMSEKDVGKGGQGFLFDDYDWKNLYCCIKRSLLFFKDSTIWSKIINNAMKCDYSWEYSAEMYNDLFKSVVCR